jgi:hypothetical protein
MVVLRADTDVTDADAGIKSIWVGVLKFPATIEVK